MFFALPELLVLVLLLLLCGRGPGYRGLPLHQGVVVDWESAEALWRHSFTNVLRVEPSDHAVLMSESPNVTDSGRRTMCVGSSS